METKQIGKRIKTARKDKGITQENFAEQLGVSVSFISQVEAGDKKFNLARISEVSKLLEKPVSYFIDGFEKEKDSNDIEEIMNLLQQLSLKKLKLIREVIKVIALDEE